MSGIAHVLVPLDLGESSERTLEYARMLARPFGATLALMHVVPNPYVTAASDVYLPPPQEFLDELERDARQRLDAFMTDDDRRTFRAEPVLKIGDPACEIVNYARAWPADLIVMSTHGRTGMAHLILGSVAERVVRTAPCPVLTIR
jgi:nucleotide-binding universal stress UspA family protein